VILADKKIMELEGELEETKELADKYTNPQDHGKLYRAQSDMTMLSRGVPTKVTIKPRLIRQNRSIDPGKNPPLAFMQTWQSKESGISVSMEDEVRISQHIPFSNRKAYTVVGKPLHRETIKYAYFY